MTEPQNPSDFRINRRRIRSRPSIYDSINKSRTTLLINMIIEGAAAVIMIVGFTYFLRFLFYWKSRMVDLYFNIILGTIIFFMAGWYIYIFIKLRDHYRLFKKASMDE